MSKDMLGSVVRAAVGVPQDRLAILAKLTSKMAGDAPQGAAWHAHLEQLVQNGLPDLIAGSNKPRIISVTTVDENHIIVRAGGIVRTSTPQQVVDATGRVQYLDKDVLATMPPGEGDEVDVHFFRLGRYLPVGEVMKEYELRGLVPDPRAQAAVNEADPAFADQYPNGSQWGNNCYLTFDRWDDERDVHCSRRDDDCHGLWWFAGVRK